MQTFTLAALVNLLPFLVIATKTSSTSSHAPSSTSSHAPSSTSSHATSSTSSHAPSATACAAIHENINFDALSTSTVGLADNTTTGNLFFQAFGIFSDASQVSGIEAHSQPNFAGSGGIQETLNGNPMITTNFPGGNVTSFDINNIYLGCFLSANTADAEAPQACSVSMTGYKGSDNSVANGQQVCSYTVNYNPSTNLGNQQMTDSGPFPSTCKGLQFLVFLFTIQPATENSLQERLSLGIDNVDVDTYHC